MVEDLQRDLSVNAPASLSNTELKAIFSCDASVLGTGATGPVHWDQVGGTSTALVAPVLPPYPDTDTRSFFLRAIGVTTPGSCVNSTTPADNEGTDPVFRTNSANLIFPYSISVYLAQSQNGHGTGQQGNQVLGSGRNGKTVISPTVGSPGALTLNPMLTLVKLTRPMYNVVRDTGTSTHVPTYLQPLLGAANNTGYLCTNATAQADIQSYGFRLLGSNCGVVS